MALTLPLGIRLAAGLLGTAVDRVTALPAEFPSMAVTFAGQALRTAMRVRQEVAELATRGDELLAPLTNRAQEHPEWATFDEDEDDESVVVRPPGSGRGGASVAGGVFTDVDSDIDIDSDSDIDTDTDTDTDTAVTLADGTPLVDPPEPGTSAPGETVPTPAGFVVGPTAAPAALLGGSPGDVVIADVAPAVIPVANARRTTARPRSRTSIKSDHRLTIAELKERTQLMTVAEVQALLAQEEAGPNRAAYLTLLGNRLMTLQHEDR